MKRYLYILLSCWIVFNIHATPLPAAQVFQTDVKSVDPNTFTLEFKIKPGYFLYKERLKLIADNDRNFQIGTIIYPVATQKTVISGHSYEIYRNELNLSVPILGKLAGNAELHLKYQGCSDDGFCYPPEEKAINLQISDSLALQSATLKSSALAKNQVNSEKSTYEKLFSQNSLLYILFIFYGFGLLLAFTPCVLPMVPVLSGIIVGQGKNITPFKAFMLSLTYVLSMSITYALVGAIAAVLGANLQINLQSPWVISSFSVIFIFLALSMFGWFELRLPKSWHSKISHTSRNQSSGQYVGTAIMGSLSTLILSPCVTAPLIGVLSYIAQSKNVFLGSFILFIMGLGMGTPLMIIGVSAGKWLPKAGHWMHSIKNFFGVLMLAISISLLSRILPGFVSMLLWATLLIFTGIFNGALNSSTKKWEQINQGIAIIALVYGLLILIGASMGNRNPLLPLKFNVNKPVETQFSRLKPIETAIQLARGKPVLLDFYADWCVSCKVMEETTFQDPKVAAILKKFALIKVNLTANNQNSQEIMQHFQVIAPPTFIFYDSKGKLLSQFTSTGEYSAQKMHTLLESIVKTSP